MIFIIKGFRTIVFNFFVISHNISADMSSGLLQVFVKLENPTWNFELHPLLNPQGSPVPIPLTITINHNNKKKIIHNSSNPGQVRTLSL